MYLALWLFAGLLLSVPVAALALLAALAAERLRTRKEGKRIRRPIAVVLGAALILALSSPGAGLHAVTFLFPLCLAIGCVAGYAAIERIARHHFQV